MINKSMNEKPKNDQLEKKVLLEQKPKTNDQCGLHFSSSLKIVDKDTEKVLLNIRCD